MLEMEPRQLMRRREKEYKELNLADESLSSRQLIAAMVEHPRLIADMQLDEHPGPIVVRNGTPVIPAGYQGLLVWDQMGAEPR